jgi:UDP-N-acetylmuramate dehydrogenase
MRTLHGVPLAPLTTLRLGGPAARLVEVETEEDILAVVRSETAPLFVLGGGSNVVVADEGWPGVALRIGTRGVNVSDHGDGVTVEVAAGEPWDDLVARAVDEGWAGVECLSGIPGLVGATPIQNVGAYGQEVDQTITRVRVLDRERGAFVDMRPEECGFAYRASIFKHNDRWIVTRVTFRFARKPTGTIRYTELARALGAQEAPLRQVRDTVIALRRAKGMVLDPGDPDSVSAGSFFTNPIVSAEKLAALEATYPSIPRFPSGDRFKLAAGWLVENAGFCKGYGAGRVGVSRKHALALVNRGGGTAAELLGLAREIQRGVHARFGVELVPEPVMVQGTKSA